MNDTKTVKTIQIFEGDSGQVLINQLNGDRFVLSIQEVINASGAFSRQRDLSKQFDILFQKLGEWSSLRRDAIRSSHLTIRDSGFLFVVVQKGTAFDEPLSNDLTDLDLEIAENRDLDLISLDVLAIPNSSSESLAAFISMESLS